MWLVMARSGMRRCRAEGFGVAPEGTRPQAAPAPTAQVGNPAAVGHVYRVHESCMPCSLLWCQHVLSMGCWYSALLCQPPQTRHMSSMHTCAHSVAASKARAAVHAGVRMGQILGSLKP